jgi:hypothetical protein
VFVAIVVGALLIWLTWKVAFSHQRIIYSVQMTPLVARGSGFAAELRIFYGSDTTTPLARPVVVAIRLASRAARDIPTSAFDNHKPLAVDLGRRGAAPASEQIAGSWSTGSRRDHFPDDHLADDLV